jgi:hypothetical protein
MMTIMSKNAEIAEAVCISGRISGKMAQPPLDVVMRHYLLVFRTTEEYDDKE